MLLLNRLSKKDNMERQNFKNTSSYIWLERHTNAVHLFNPEGNICHSPKFIHISLTIFFNDNLFQAVLELGYFVITETFEKS